MLWGNPRRRHRNVAIHLRVRSLRWRRTVMRMHTVRRRLLAELARHLRSTGRRRVALVRRGDEMVRELSKSLAVNHTRYTR